MENNDTLRYPVGRFQKVPFDADTIAAWIAEIGQLPGQLRTAVSDLNEKQLETPYRSGGWTVRQVVHHLADSHMNSFIRFKWALTEETPTIKPYEEALWAETADAKHANIEWSLQLLEMLHLRWVALLQSLTIEDYHKTFVHPASGVIELWTNIGIYAWHGRHHLAHINSLRERFNG
jgi:uncharacterized damage-inducible protein DinB